MTEAVEVKPPSLKIEDLNDLKRVLIIAKGGDPDAIQAIADFMDLKNPLERSYFPDKTVSLCIGQLDGFGKIFFKGSETNPFRLIAESLSVGFMGFKGFKSNQFVDMTRNTPDLKDLQGIPEETKGGFLSGLLNRGSKE